MVWMRVCTPLGVWRGLTRTPGGGWKGAGGTPLSHQGARIPTHARDYFYSKQKQNDTEIQLQILSQLRQSDAPRSPRPLRGGRCQPPLRKRQVTMAIGEYGTTSAEQAFRPCLKECYLDLRYV